MYAMFMAKQGIEKEEPGVTEGARRATGVTPPKTIDPGQGHPHPDPEVSDKPKRRQFTAEYKLSILEQIDQCINPGEVGALMRREGLFSSTVSGWRRQRERGKLDGLTPKKRGRKAKPKDPRDKIIAEMNKENKQLKLKLAQAETVIDIQKKVAMLLGIPLKTLEDEEND